MEKFIKNTKVYIKQGDITLINADAIVNAANTSLAGGGGVDGAIHRAGGQIIYKECKDIIDKQGQCPTGTAVITHGGNLPAKWVIHTAGPIYKDGTKNEAKLLESCYRNSLLKANELGLESIAFPSISTGIYNYPIKEASIIALNTINNFLKNNNTDLKEIGLILFDSITYQHYKNALQGL